MDPATLHRTETSQRRATVDEVFALAAALDCSLLYLLTPTGAGEQVEVVPTVTVDGATARRWVRGTRPLPGQDAGQFAQTISEEEAAASFALIAATQQLGEAQGRLDTARREVAPSVVLDELEAALTRAKEAWNAAQRRMQEAG